MLKKFCPNHNACYHFCFSVIQMKKHFIFLTWISIFNRSSDQLDHIPFVTFTFTNIINHPFESMWKCIWIMWMKWVKWHYKIAWYKHIFKGKSKLSAFEVDANREIIWKNNEWHGFHERGKSKSNENIGLKRVKRKVKNDYQY